MEQYEDTVMFKKQKNFQVIANLLLITSVGFEECAVLWSLKDKASRIERIVGEHRLFSQGLKELQDWVCEAQRVLNSCISTTSDKGVLEERMLHLEVRRDKTGVGSPNDVEIKWTVFVLFLAVCFSYLQALLAARQEREIQLKMLLTRGEAVQRNTSAEGVPVIRKQIQDLKDSWDSLLSASIQCKRLW